MVNCQRRKKRWWSKIDGECPISLAPLSELAQPPFALMAEGSKRPHYFDAQFLANFLVSTADFIDPVNRQPLVRQQCLELDEHLRRFHPDEAHCSVADAFDLFEQRGHKGDDRRQRFYNISSVFGRHVALTSVAVPCTILAVASRL